MAEAKASGHEVLNLGAVSTESVDYPDFARAVGRAIQKGQAALGVLICSTGIGMSMAANRVDGIRAALCRTVLDGTMARAHNDANVLCLGQRTTPSAEARAIFQAFLSTPFDGGRHQRRVDKLSLLEKQGDKP